MLDNKTTTGEWARPKVCVFGASLDVGNRGVLALGVSVAQLLACSSPDADIFFHYGARSGGTKDLTGSRGKLNLTVLNCRMSWRSRPSEHILVILCLAMLYRLGWQAPAKRNRWLRTLLDAQLVGEIRGGDSFSDIYGFRKLLVGSLPLLSAVLMKCPYVMLPQTYGPFRLPASRAIARFLLRQARTIFTRDRNCEALVFELCGRNPIFCPDVAFTLEAKKPQNLQIKPDGLELNGEELVVGVNVSGLLYMGGYTGRNMFGLRSDYRELVDRLIRGILTSTQAKVLLVPHVFGSEQEEEACASIMATYEPRYPGRLFAVTQPLSEREVKWVIGKTSFFVGSRMHACIAALSQLIPTVGLAYSDKFLGVFESAGVGGGIIDLRSSPTPEVVDQTLSAFEKRTELGVQLQSKIPAVRDSIVSTFRQMMPIENRAPKPAPAHALATE